MWPIFSDGTHGMPTMHIMFSWRWMSKTITEITTDTIPTAITTAITTVKRPAMAKTMYSRIGILFLSLGASGYSGGGVSRVTRANSCPATSSFMLGVRVRKKKGSMTPLAHFFLSFPPREMQPRDRYLLDVDILNRPPLPQIGYKGSLGRALFEPPGVYPCKTSPYRLLNQADLPPPVTKPVPKSIKPSRILDAPELVNDYYLNLLDWSAHDTLAVCLDSSVWIMNGSRTAEVVNGVDNITCSVSFSPDGTCLATGWSHGPIYIYQEDSTMSYSMHRILIQHSDRVSVLDWSDSHILASGSKDHTVKIHDTRTRRPCAQHAIHRGEVCGMKWSPNGLYLATGCNNNMLIVWDARQRKILHDLQGHKAAVKAIDWAPFNPNLLASGGGNADKNIKLWNVTTGECRHTTYTASQVSAVLWLGEDKLASSHGYSDYAIYMWSYPEMKKVQTLLGHEDRILSLKKSQDGQTIASLGADEALRMWTLERPKARRRERAPLEMVYLR